MIIEKQITPTTKYTFIRRDNDTCVYCGEYATYRHDGTTIDRDYNKFGKSVGITISSEYHTPNINQVNYFL